MKIQIRCEQTGQEILDSFIKLLNENKIDAPNLEDIKFFITNKTNQEVEVAPDKIRLVYDKKKV